MKVNKKMFFIFPGVVSRSFPSRPPPATLFSMLVVFNTEKPAQPRLLIGLMGVVFLATLFTAGWLSRSRSQVEPLPMAPPIPIQPGLSLSLPVGWKHKIQVSSNGRETILTASPPNWSAKDDVSEEDDPDSTLPDSIFKNSKFNLILRQSTPGHPMERLAERVGTNSEDVRNQIAPARLGPLIAAGLEQRIPRWAILTLLANAPDGREFVLHMFCHSGEIPAGRVALEQIARSLRLDLPPASEAISRFTQAAHLRLSVPEQWLVFYRSPPSDLPAGISPAPLYLQPSAESEPTGQTWQMTVYPTWLSADRSPEQLLTERVARDYLWLTPPSCQSESHERFQTTRLTADSPPQDAPAIFWLITPKSSAASRPAWLPAILLKVNIAVGQTKPAEEAVRQFLAKLEFLDVPPPKSEDLLANWRAYHAQTPLRQQLPLRNLSAGPVREWFLSRYDGHPLGYHTSLYRYGEPSETATSGPTQPSPDETRLMIETLNRYPHWHGVQQAEMTGVRSCSIQERNVVLGLPGQGVRDLRIALLLGQPDEPATLRAETSQPAAKLEKTIVPPTDLLADPELDLLLVWLARTGQTGDMVRFRTFGLIPGNMVCHEARVLTPRANVGGRKPLRYIELRSDLGSEPQIFEFTPEGKLRREVQGLFTVVPSSESELQSYFENIPQHLANFMKDLTGP